jgi:hypothetical protein
MDIEKLLRSKLKEILIECTGKEKRLFKLMYSPGNPEADIDIIVDNMPRKNLDWAILQVENTLYFQEKE